MKAVTGDHGLLGIQDLGLFTSLGSNTIYRLHLY